MPTYTYKGVSPSGEKISGVVEAFDEIEAMDHARNLCYVVQDVSKVSETKNFLAHDITAPRIKAKNLAVLCSQFAIILKAGLSATRAVALVAEQTSDKYLKKVLEDVSGDVASGHALADSLESKGQHLPRVFIETIRAGEESGRLPESFKRLQSYYEKRSKVAAKVAGALTYPIFVLVIGVVVVVLMMVLVIPTIASMVTSMGTEMPAITQFLIGISGWFSANIVWIIIVAIMLAVALKLYANTEAGKDFLASLQMRIPVTGTVVVYSGASQFANTMATLIAAGLSTSKAIQITGRVMSNYILSKEVSRMEAGLEEGRSLGECMEECKYFPSTLVEMAAVGEQTGELETTLETIGEYYDSETQRVTDKALSLMEPALLILMAIFAGFIVVALYLPLFSMYANM